MLKNLNPISTKGHVLDGYNPASGQDALTRACMGHTKIFLGNQNRSSSTILIKAAIETKMCPLKFVETAVSNQFRVTPKMPIEISSDDARQGDMALNTLYVLGFGLAGAILANALILAFPTVP
jgi:hypothetical protein